MKAAPAKPGRRTERRGRASVALLLVRAWILWTGTAAALESSTYPNTGPVGSWRKAGSFADLSACTEGRNAAVSEFLSNHPEAVKRREDLVFEKKALPGDEEMIVHSVTRFVCLPDTVEPPAPDKVPLPPPAPDKVDPPAL